MSQIKDKIKLKTNINLTVQSLFIVLFFVSIFSGMVGGAISSYFVKDLKHIITEVGTQQITLEEESAVIDVVEKVSPSVVSITSEQSTLDFFGRVTESQSSGTGFIVTEDGLIATNKHVVSDTRAQYSVFTSDGKEYQAEVVAQDPYFDIAFVKIEAEGLTKIEVGNSDDIKIGQKVVAIGNALGQFDNTVTTGIVSALGRAIEAGDSSSSNTETLENMIQTDTAINPGNSGGPLVNISGQVIGINTAVAGNSEGIGFAIPINVVKTAIDSVVESGEISRPMIGVRYINVTKDFATRNKLPVDAGVLIYASGNDLAVLPNTPASQAGLTEGDIITKIDDNEIKEGQSLISILYKYKPGDKVTITYVRGNKTKTADIILAKSS